MKFLSEKHKLRFEELTKDIHPGDKERLVAMFVFAGNDSLYSKSSKLYDFKKNEFVFDIKENEEGENKICWKTYLSSSEEKLALLALSLYGARDHVGIYELFRCLDNNNTELALNAIKYAFS